MAIVGLVPTLLAIGYLARSRIGHRIRRTPEIPLLDKIPGYRLAEAFMGNGPLVTNGGRAMRPNLAAIEEGLAPTLVMGGFADGRLIVFIPGTPALMSGVVYIFTPDKVWLLDGPLLSFLKAISSWGLCPKELVEQSETDATRP